MAVVKDVGARAAAPQAMEDTSGVSANTNRADSVPEQLFSEEKAQNYLAGILLLLLVFVL